MLCEKSLRLAFSDAAFSRVFASIEGVIEMLKKILLGSALTLATGGLVMGTSAYSYLKTGLHSVQDSLKDQIPIEVEIKRARELISDLKPEIASNLKMIAREEVEIGKLEREVAAKQTTVTKSKDAILKLKEDLQSGVRYVTYQGKKYSIDQVRQDLTDRFKHHQTLEATSEKLVKILDARQRNLIAARRKLDEMLSAKRELEVQVENLQARLTMVQVAQTGSKLTFDDGALGQVRQTLDEIGTRIDVAEKLANGIEQIGTVPVEPAQSPEDLIEKISDYFQEESSSKDGSGELEHLAEIPL